MSKSEAHKFLPIPENEIRRQLARILDYPELQASGRRREMLRFVVEETLAGRAAEIKATSIAMAVFGRGAEFDQQSDPVVRLEARKLRRDLDNYYAGPGRADAIRIEIPKGHYVPTFLVQTTHPAMRPVDHGAGNGHSGAKGRSQHRWSWPLAFAGSAAVALIVVGAVVTLRGSEAVYRVDPQTSATPSLLVEHLRPLDESEEVSLVALGITQALASDLLRFGYFRVHVMPRQGAPHRPSEFGTDAPATQFVVKGTVNREDDGIVISAQVVRTEDGRLLWSQTFTDALSTANLSRIPERIAAEIATAIGQEYGVIRDISLNEYTRSHIDPSLDSYLCVARAIEYRRTHAKEEYEATRSCLEAAVVRDETYAQAWAMLGFLRLDAARFSYEPDLSLEEGLYRAKEAASRAIAVDPQNTEAYKALSAIEQYLGDEDAAIEMAERAVALNPNAPDALANLGNRLSMSGRLDEGVPLLKQAIERSVRPAPYYFQMIAIDHMMRREWDEMAEMASRAVADDSSVSFALLAIANAGLGNAHLAHENLEAMAIRWTLLAEDPRSAFELHNLHPSIVNALVEGLEMAHRTADVESGQ